MRWDYSKMWKDRSQKLRAWCYTLYKKESSRGLGNIPFQNCNSLGEWETYESALKAKTISLVDVPTELLDYVWTEGRPEIPNGEIFIHLLKFHGNYSVSVI